MIPDTTKSWWYTASNQQRGPVEWAQLKDMAKTGQLGAADKVWCQGMPAWTLASEIQGLLRSSSAPVNQEPVASPYAAPAIADVQTQKPGNVKRVSFPLLLGLAVGYFLLYAVVFASLFMGGDDDVFIWVSAGAGGLALICGISMAVYGCICLYRAWYALQDGHARTTPGKAVGFMFIPFYNFYWMFVAGYGWSQDYNLFTQRHNQTDAPAVNENLFLATNVMYCCLMVPFINLIVMIPVIITAWMSLYQMCRAINYFAEN